MRDLAGPDARYIAGIIRVGLVALERRGGG